MAERLLKPVLVSALALCCLFAFYLASSKPELFTNQMYMAGFLFLQVLIASVWKYRQMFFPLLIVAFLWAGMNVPLSGVWTSARWLVLGVGALAGFVLFLKERTHHFGWFHLTALCCVSVAAISSQISQFSKIALLKALSLLLLFLWGSSGARLSIVGRERHFLAAVLIGCEILTYTMALAYLGVGIRPMGNPNSLGAAMGVVVVPLLFWAYLAAQDSLVRWRRLMSYLLAMFLTYNSQARAGMVAAIASCAFLCIGLRRYKILIQGVAALALISTSTAIFAPQRFQEFTSSFTGILLYKGDRDSGVLDSRKSPWEQTVLTIKDHPWLGSGFGTNANTLRGSVSFGNFSSTSEVTAEHGSSYLAIACGVGLVGLTAFLALLLLLLGKIGHTFLWMRRTANPCHIAVPITAVLLAGIVHAAFEDWMFAVGYYVTIFFWTVAFVLVDVVPDLARGESERLHSWRQTPDPHSFHVTITPT